MFVSPPPGIEPGNFCLWSGSDSGELTGRLLKKVQISSIPQGSMHNNILHLQLYWEPGWFILDQATKAIKTNAGYRKSSVLPRSNLCRDLSKLIINDGQGLKREHVVNALRSPESAQVALWKLRRCRCKDCGWLKTTAGLIDALTNPGFETVQ